MINLALVDILKATFNLPMTIVSSYNQSWMFGHTGNIKYNEQNKNLKLILFKGCDFFGFCGGLFGFTSITTMVLMTIERYLIIKNPLISLDLNTRLIISMFYLCYIYIY